MVRTKQTAIRAQHPSLSLPKGILATKTARKTASGVHGVKALPRLRTVTRARRLIHKMRSSQSIENVRCITYAGFRRIVNGCLSPGDMTRFTKTALSDMQVVVEAMVVQCLEEAQTIAESRLTNNMMAKKVKANFKNDPDSYLYSMSVHPIDIGVAFDLQCKHKEQHMLKDNFKEQYEDLTMSKDLKGLP